MGTQGMQYKEKVQKEDQVFKVISPLLSPMFRLLSWENPAPANW